MITVPPHPDPPPAAVRAHHKATVSWWYPQWFTTTAGRYIVRCHIPRHGVGSCRVIGRRP